MFLLAIVGEMYLGIHGVGGVDAGGSPHVRRVVVVYL